MTRKFNILSIEDNTDYQDFLRIALGECDVAAEIEFFDNAEQALDTLALRTDLGGVVNFPDLILIDINLPGMSGLDFVRMLKSDSNLRLIPAVIMSSSASAKDCAKAYQNYANSYLRKPSSLRDLMSLMISVLDYWARNNMRSKAHQT